MRDNWQTSVVGSLALRSTCAATQHLRIVQFLASQTTSRTGADERTRLVETIPESIRPMLSYMDVRPVASRLDGIGAPLAARVLGIPATEEAALPLPRFMSPLFDARTLADALHFFPRVRLLILCCTPRDYCCRDDCVGAAHIGGGARKPGFVDRRQQECVRSCCLAEKTV